MCLQQGGVTPLSPSVRDAFFFCCFLVTFAVVGRQKCRPSLSCFYYCYSYYLRLPNVFATRRGDTPVAQRSRCFLFLLLFSYLCCCWATGVSPLLELLSLLLFILSKVTNYACNKEGRHFCRPAFAMHSFYLLRFSYLCCCWATGVSTSVRDAFFFCCFFSYLCCCWATRSVAPP